jgi:phytoene/squalene synthetase
MARFGVIDADFLPDSTSENAMQLVAYYASAARLKMDKGSPLVFRIPGRAGWELRMVVQGGLRILEKIAALQFATWRSRPILTLWDAPIIFWRALRMK